MAAPQGIDLNKLTIFHYNADNTSYETLDVRVNADGTISFTVTHFSNFLFAEQKETVNNNTTNNNNSSSSNTNENGNTTTIAAPSWKPKTADEIKRYAVYGKDKVAYTADAANAYPVKVINAMQGKLCFDSFESVLGDYKIGRTYSILPDNKVVYKMPTAARITITIPKALRVAGREYKMICVSQKGATTILDDIDENPNTITFLTDAYYAFALIYKDAVAAQQ